MMALTLAVPGSGGPGRGSVGTPTPVFPARRVLVHVTATVIDQHGQPVKGLDADEFRIEDDGHMRPISLLAWTGILPETPTESSADLPVDISVVLDDSGSMIGGMKVARALAVRSLELTPWARAVSLIVFSDEVATVFRAVNGHSVPASDIREVRPAQGTRLFDAICQAVSELEATDAAGRKVMIVISDGVDTTSQASADNVYERVLASGVLVYAVAKFGNVVEDDDARIGRAFLDGLATTSGGRILKIPGSDEGIERLLDVLRRELRGQYVLGFEPSPDRPAMWHTITIRLRDKGMKVRYRASYLARAAEPRGTR